MTTQSEKALRAKFLEAQAEMPRSLKADGENTYHSSTYLTLDALSEVALPIFHRHGFALVYTIRPIREPEHGGSEMQLTLMHEMGDLHSSCPFGVRSDTNPQDIGSAITYYRRYLLGMVTGIAVDKDDDGNAGAGVGKGTHKAKPRKTRSKQAKAPAPAEPPPRTGGELPSTSSKYASREPCEDCGSEWGKGDTIFKVGERHWCSNYHCPEPPSGDDDSITF